MSKKLNSKPSGKSVWKNPYFGYLLFGVFLCLFPLAASAGIIPTSFITLMGGVLVYSVVGLGLNLLLGYSGLISLGTAGFMGLGAYLAGYLTTIVKAPFLVGVIVAIFQAVTQIHEQTLGFILKLIVVIGVMLIGGGWMMETLSEFSREVFALIAA